MKVEDAREHLRCSAPEEPTALPSSVLAGLSVEDMPGGSAFRVGTMKDGVLHLDWSGTLYRDGDRVFGEADHTWTRKYWYAAVGLEQYLDLNPASG